MVEQDAFPRMHADEVSIHDSLVRDLLTSQFPQWEGLSLRRMPSTGTDNAIYRLGAEMAIRLPRVHSAREQIGKEYDWLERLAPHLPVALPIPLAQGEPGEGYPYPWLVYRWLEGEDLQHAEVDDVNELAHDLASFVLALGRVSPEDAPPAGRRGGLLAPHDQTIPAAIQGLDGIVDIDRTLAVWREAVRADQWSASPVWVHGDLLPGNVLLRHGRMSGVIDWSAAGVGDPACEAMVAWFLPPAARAVYRRALEFDDATWARARGWVIEQTAWFIPYYAATIPDAVAAAKLRLQAVVDDVA